MSIEEKLDYCLLKNNFKAIRAIDKSFKLQFAILHCDKNRKDLSNEMEDCIKKTYLKLKKLEGTNVKLTQKACPAS